MRTTGRSLEHRMQRLEAHFHCIRGRVRRIDPELERAADEEFRARYFGRLEELLDQAGTADLDAKARELAALDGQIARASETRDIDGRRMLEFSRRSLELEVLELKGERPEVLIVAAEQAARALRSGRTAPAIPSLEEALAQIGPAEQSARGPQRNGSHRGAARSGEGMSWGRLDDIAAPGASEEL